MGSFDGWSQGEHLSPEYTGSFTKFSTTLMLRPGRYHYHMQPNNIFLLLLFVGGVIVRTMYNFRNI